jgi:hypothetical protein
MWMGVCEAADKWLSTRGKLERKEAVPFWFWAVVAIHVLLGLLMLTHPIVFPRVYDGWFFLLVSCIALHWLLFCGECIISVLEKKLLYKRYRIGQYPLHQWYMDVFSTRQCIIIAAVIAMMWLFCVGTLIWRNIELGPSQMMYTLMFAGTGNALKFFLGWHDRGVMITMDIQRERQARRLPPLFSHLSQSV